MPKQVKEIATKLQFRPARKRTKKSGKPALKCTLMLNFL